MISRNIVSSIYRSVSRSILKYASGIFSPASISKVLQYTLDSETPYTGSTLNGISVLSSLENSDSYRFPLKGRCYLFDGTNDYGTMGARITSGSPTQLSFGAWIKPTNFSATGVVAGEYNVGTSSRMWRVSVGTDARITVLISEDGGITNLKQYATVDTVASGAWVHFGFVFNANTLKLYLNGVEVSVTKSFDGTVNSLYNGSQVFVLGALFNSASPEFYLNGAIRDARVYTTAKSGAEMLAIYNQASTPYTIDTTGLLAHYWCNEEAGTTGFDSSGNDNHLTLTNITPATFHAVDQGVVYNPANNVGHTSRMVFNGTNTRVSTNQKFNIAGATLTLSAKVRTNNADGTWPIFDNGDGHGGYMIFMNNSNWLDIIMRQSESSSAYYRVRGSTSLNDGIEREVVVTINNTGATPVITATLNGVAETLTVTIAPTGSYGDNASATGVIGARVLNPLYWAGTIADVSVSNGTQSYSATGYNSTLWNTGTVSGTTQSLIVPQDESTPADSVFGSPLNYTGQAPYPATIESPCGTFDGVNDFATRGARITSGSVANLTASCWVRLTISGVAVFFVGETTESTSNFGWALYQSRVSNKLRVYVSANGTSTFKIYENPTAINDGLWHHIAFTFTNNSLKLYTDGILVNHSIIQNDTVTAIFNSASSFGIGARDVSATASDFLNGRVSDARVYSVEKSSAEILNIYKGNPDLTGLLGQYPFQEGRGTISYDISGNGNHLTLTNITESTFWANRNDSLAQDVAMLYGGRTGSSNQFIPGNVTGSNAADGNPKVFLPGKFSNPYSRLNHDPFDAAEFNNIAMPIYETLPCLTGNGTDNYVDLGSALIPATADFEISLWYYHVTNDTTRRSVWTQWIAGAPNNTIGVQANGNNLGGEAGSLRLFISGSTHVVLAGALVSNTNHFIRVTRVGNTFTLSCSVLGSGTVATGSVTFSATIQQEALRLLALGGKQEFNNGRIAYFTITTGGVTKEIPLTAGSGADLTLYTDGVESTLSTAVKGTLTSVWANTTDARMQSTENAFRAIKPINTKFRRTDTDGDDRFVILRSAATGADLTNLIEYTS